MDRPAPSKFDGAEKGENPKAQDPHAVDAPSPVVESPAPPAAPKKSKRPILFAVLGVAALGVGTYWFAHRAIESTDDAQVDADVVALAPRIAGVVTKVSFTDNEAVIAGQILAEIDDAPTRAKLAQAEATLASAVASASAADAEARIVAMNAKTNKSVTASSLYAASAGATGSRDQIAEAEARVTVAQANLSQAASERERGKLLLKSGAISQAELDRVNTTADAANATLAQARAYVASLRSMAAQASSRVEEASAKAAQARDVDVFVLQAEARAKAAHALVDQLAAARELAALDLSYTKITAPAAGIVSKKSVAVGQTLSVGVPIVQFVPTQAVWVTANFKETQVGKMRVGQPAKISIDAFPGLELKGEIESFSVATGSRFALLPPDNSSGNFTKVVQRVPVRVHIRDLPANIALRPGMNSELSIDTGK